MSARDAILQRLRAAARVSPPRPPRARRSHRHALRHAPCKPKRHTIRTHWPSRCRPRSPRRTRTSGARPATRSAARRRGRRAPAAARPGPRRIRGARPRAARHGRAGAVRPADRRMEDRTVRHDRRGLHRCALGHRGHRHRRARTRCRHAAHGVAGAALHVALVHANTLHPDLHAAVHASAGTPACRPTSCWYRRRKRPTSSRRSPMARTARAAWVVIVTEPPPARPPPPARTAPNERPYVSSPPATSRRARARSTIPRCARAFAARWTSCKASARRSSPTTPSCNSCATSAKPCGSTRSRNCPHCSNGWKRSSPKPCVHWAETAAEANAIVLGIAQAKKARRVIKGKSMASEEIELNHALAEHGVDCIESDMGEFIVQLAGEKPSHIVMPAIHKTRRHRRAVPRAHPRHALHRGRRRADPDRPRARAARSPRRTSACPA